MRIILSLLLMFATSVQAAPFLISDPDPTGAANKCIYQEGTDPAVETPVVAIPPSVLVGSCKIDLAGFSVGNHNLQVWFSSDLWGVTSVKVPFAFARPSANGTGPTNLRLVP